jgi:uncharacterized membrane protein
MQNAQAVNSPDNTPTDKDTGRLEAFSDGVFSIAMTLLVLELKVPPVANHPTPRQLASQLFHQWPSYLAFTTSFFTILIMWVNHHGIFRLVRRTDSTLLFANGLLLLLVTAVPFPTALVASYLRTPAASTACAIYGFSFVLISLGYALLLHAARRNKGRLLMPKTLDQINHRLRSCYRVGTPLYFLSTVAAPIAPWLTLAICTALWLYWAIPRDELESAFTG